MSDEARFGEWRPIEAAPKDGTEILLGEGMSVEKGSWTEQDDGTGDWSDGECLPLRPTPTHWMPLPPPPGEAPG